MIRRSTLYLFQELKHRRAFVTTNSESNASNEKWDLLAGVLVERLPIITKSLNRLEQQYNSYLHQLEFENSLKSNQELQHEKELIQAELVKKGQLEIDLDDTFSKQTAQDLEDLYSEEAKKFKYATRTSIDDSASSNSKPEDTLYLLVQHKLGDKTYFLFPQGVRLENENMRQAAGRILEEKCGDKLNVRFYGNAPCGFHKYKYPNGVSSEAVGAKIFFYRTALIAGSVDASINKYMWLEKTALAKTLKNSSYTENVQKFLF